MKYYFYLDLDLNITHLTQYMLTVFITTRPKCRDKSLSDSDTKRTNLKRNPTYFQPLPLQSNVSDHPKYKSITRESITKSCKTHTLFKSRLQLSRRPIHLIISKHCLSKTSFINLFVISEMSSSLGYAPAGGPESSISTCTASPRTRVPPLTARSAQIKILHQGSNLTVFIRATRLNNFSARPKITVPGYISRLKLSRFWPVPAGHWASKISGARSKISVPRAPVNFEPCFTDRFMLCKCKIIWEDAW